MGIRKTLLLVLDGIADRKISKLGNKTPLEYAKTPNLDLLAEKGRTGLIEIIGDGLIPTSSSGALSLLGYNVKELYPGDAMMEAIGLSKIPISEGDLAIHASFATSDGESKIVDRRVCRDLSDNEAKELANSVTKSLGNMFPKLNISLINYRFYRNVILIKNPNHIELSDNISNTDPAHKKYGYFDLPQKNYKLDILPCKPLNESRAANFTAKLLNQYLKESRRLLKNHPINIDRKLLNKPQADLLITRNASNYFPEFEKFPGSLCMIIEMPGEKAIGDLIQAKIIEKSFLINPSPNFYRKLSKNILTKLSNPIDLLYVHTKGPDEPSHDGNIFEKIRVIELIDKYLIRNILRHLEGKNIDIIITSDHATPCELMVHSSDYVPLLIKREGEIADPISSFNESSCSKGSIGVIKGHNLLQFLVRHPNND